MFGDKIKAKYQRWLQNRRRCEYWKKCSIFKETSYTCLNSNWFFGEDRIIDRCGTQRTFKEGPVRHGQ